MWMTLAMKCQMVSVFYSAVGSSDWTVSRSWWRKAWTPPCLPGWCCSEQRLPEWDFPASPHSSTRSGWVICLLAFQSSSEEMWEVPDSTSVPHPYWWSQPRWFRLEAARILSLCKGHLFSPLWLAWQSKRNIKCIWTSPPPVGWAVSYKLLCWPCTVPYRSQMQQYLGQLH